ncbi:MAG: hypothetical protein Q9178_008097, partial [Gyalolechia marmorata]
VKVLQSSIAYIEPSSDTFMTALAKMLNNFSAPPDTPVDVISCLRATLQILVIYTLASGDSSWIRFPEALQIERMGNSLAEVISSRNAIPKPTERDSIEKCRVHALLHEKKGQIERQRGSLVNTLDVLAQKLFLAAPFEHYDQGNRKHYTNAIDLAQQLSPGFHLHGNKLANQNTLSKRPSKDLKKNLLYIGIKSLMQAHKYFFLPFKISSIEISVSKKCEH